MMLEIDGSRGEGGGQILRTSIALSAISKTPVKIIRIRNNRPKPGLAAQHLTGISAVGELCGAEVVGLEKGSTEIVFKPGKIEGGSFELDIGTAGSITLVLQAVLPVVLKAGTPTSLELTGGTDVKFAPPIDYFKFVLKPFLERMGAGIDIKEVMRGYYPKGGGKVLVEITMPEGGLKSLELRSQGKLQGFFASIHYANLPEHISVRIKKTVEVELKRFDSNAELEIEVEKAEQSRSPGVGLTLRAIFDNTVLCSSALGERGVPAEKLAKSASMRLIDEIRSGATADAHTADQLLPYLIGTQSVILAKNPITAHTLTNLAVIRQFYGSIFKQSEQGQVIEIKSL